MARIIHTSMVTYIDKKPFAEAEYVRGIYITKTCVPGIVQERREAFGGEPRALLMNVPYKVKSTREARRSLWKETDGLLCVAVLLNCRMVVIFWNCLMMFGTPPIPVMFFYKRESAEAWLEKQYYRGSGLPSLAI